MFSMQLKVSTSHREIAYIALLTISTLLLSSCVTVRRGPTVPIKPPRAIVKTPTTPLPPSIQFPQPRADIIHTIAPGETFWRISKMYDVPMPNILQENHLNESDILEMGEKLHIPQAAQLKPVISLYPNNKWEYIIIHHSATHEGSSLAFHRAHLQKGWDKGVGYHFVIDNASDEKHDGQIEVTPRWLKQQDGAHCKASDMNIKGIGICLVGNFNNDKVSKKQMESLTDLVKTLQNYYKIPTNHVMGHGKVAESQTDCPGKEFPWSQFQKKLRQR
jgi:LysM repeat protein